MASGDDHPLLSVKVLLVDGLTLAQALEAAAHDLWLIAQDAGVDVDVELARLLELLPGPFDAAVLR